MQHIPETVAVEARAEITWGKSPEQVLAMLQAKGVGDKDALALIEELMKERAASIRGDGVKKTVIGSLFCLAPVSYYFVSVWLGSLNLKFFAGLLVVGVIGIAKLTNGLSMLLRPGSVTGDLANPE
jgi:hypothetical protein